MCGCSFYFFIFYYAFPNFVRSHRLRVFAQCLLCVSRGRVYFLCSSIFFSIAYVKEALWLLHVVLLLDSFQKEVGL